MKTRTHAALALLVVLGCSEPAGEDTPGVEPFAGSAATLELLGEKALEAVAAGDSATLETLRLSEREHNDVIYPELPAFGSFPVDIAWENIQLRNRRDVGRQLGWFRDREVRYEGTFCQGEPETYATFTAQRDCWVVFEDAEHGRLRVQLFKDVIARGGGYKLVRYYDEPPRRMEAS